MRLRSHPSVLLACLVLWGTTESTARAQTSSDRATARALGEDGEHALEAKDFKKAEDDFRRADALVHAPTLMLGLARALAGEGKFVDAQEAYKRIIREGVAPGAPDVFSRAIESAKKELQDVAPHIAALTITVTGAAGVAVSDAKVMLDDAAVSAASLDVKRYVDPGPHVVRVTATGFKTAEMKISVPDGGNATAPVVLEKDTSAAVVPTAPPAAAPTSSIEGAPAAPATSSGPSPWPWVAFGVGGVGLGVGVVTAVLAAGKHSDLASACPGGTCPPEQYGNVDSYHTLSMVSSAGFIVAGLGAAVGVTLLVLQPKAESATGASLRVEPFIGPGSVGAIGAF